jgi:hypothetical protein
MKKNKQAQFSNPQLDLFENVTQQAQEAGVTLPDDIGNWTPQEIALWAEELGFLADKGIKVMDQVEDHANAQRDLAIQQGTEMIAKTKTFNLKKAQFSPSPDEYGMPDQGGEFAPDLDSMPGQDPFEDGLMGDEDGETIWADAADFRDWLDQQTDRSSATDIISGKLSSTFGEAVGEALEAFYEHDLSRQAKLTIASGIYEELPDENKPEEANIDEGIIPANYKQVSAFVKDMDKQIQKMAQQNSKKSYNLTKTAQHKGAVDNMNMYGPSETRIDPFLRQPVSDYHIVERNKGFGLVVDDIWNIDWETIWRGTIMDKYSRPYKDKDGNWTGGYIQKRFEVDKWIPEENNLQLKPGQLRKPYIAKERSTEARLEAMRAENDRGYEPASSGKPYNWSKEASSKKKS